MLGADGPVRGAREERMKLPWSKTREAELSAWAVHSFPQVAPECAVPAALLLAESIDAVETLPVDEPLAETASLNELHRVQLFLALEREFGFTISDQDAKSLNTPAEIVAYVERRMTENKQGRTS